MFMPTQFPVVEVAEKINVNVKLKIQTVLFRNQLHVGASEIKNKKYVEAY